MHKTRKLFGALVLALCLLMSVALGSKALAAGEGPNTLKTVATASTDEAFVADIATANIRVDVYKLADATKSEGYDAYDYELVAPFTGLQSMFTSALSSDAGATWEDVADAAVALLDGAEAVVSNVPVGEDINLYDGIYLVVPHGAGVTNGAVAYSETYRYTFAPSVVALPTKVQEGYDQQGYLDGPISSSDAGEWLTEVTVALKPSQEPLYGDLEIIKNVPEFAGDEPATFVFHVTGEGYDEYASVYVTSEGTTSTTLTHIPAGLEVTVTEVYNGGRYTPQGADSATVTIVASETSEVPVSVSFTNVPDDTYTGGGHGIENHFEYTTDGDQWVLTAQNGLVAAETQE